MSFDIDQLSETTERSYRVIIGHNPGDVPEPVGFIVVGPASDQFRAAERAISIQNIIEAEKRKVSLDLSREEDAGKMFDGMESRREVLLEHCVVGWFGFRKGAEEAPFNRDNLKAVLRSRPHWAKRLVAEIETATNFDAA